MKTSIAYSLFEPSDMAQVDICAEESGLSILSLMERAGQAVAASALRHYPQAHRYVVFCGGGNNGGDGYVAARGLRESGAEVAVYAFGDRTRMKDAAKAAHDLWSAAITSIDQYAPQKGDVVIDAIFGAGLSHAVPDAVSDIIRLVREGEIPVIAIDLPSGLCGRRGVPLGHAFQADRTVTFMAKKPGHVLMPGRTLCGALEVFDIGIPQRILAHHAGQTWENHPALWSRFFDTQQQDTHKFRRGHLTVFSGPSHATGAARMTAMAGLRAGAGIVTVASPREAVAPLSADLTAVMVAEIETAGALEKWREDKRHATYVLGPGFGDMDRARCFVSLLSDNALVLDADGITAFRDNPGGLFQLFAKEAPRILTPHGGEFARLFPEIDRDVTLGKIDKTRSAAASSNAVIVYKGADTVVAAPDGRAVVNTNAPPFLATAGSGDVLAGIAGAFLAQQVPAFEAAAAAVWLHGETANRLGPGLTAEDLVAEIRPIGRFD